LLKRLVKSIANKALCFDAEIESDSRARIARPLYFALQTRLACWIRWILLL